MYVYFNKYPELQEHRLSIIATMNDYAEGTVKQKVKAREWTATKTWLEVHHPVYRRKQTIEHTGTVAVQAGLLLQEQIAAMSDADLQKMITVRKAELAGADDVRDEGTEGSPPSTDSTG
jgi:hypothetical protein